MKWQFLIAWRNLWRNPRRTSVILVSIVVGIGMMLSLGALMWGMVQGMLDSSLANLTGHVQVHHPAFMDDPALENRMRDPGRLEEALEAVLPADARVARRLRIDMVVTNARHSGGVTLVGSDLEAERRMTFLGSASIEGEFPAPDSTNGILVGRELLEQFETRLGNKLILTARDADGEVASKAFRITGVFDTVMESSEAGLAFAPVEAVQAFLKVGEGVSEVSILLPDIEQSGQVAAALSARLDPERFAVSPWQELSPLITAYIRVWDTFAYIWALVIFVAMSFGLVNTLLMAVYERVREFGLVRALGMRPGQVLSGVLIESVLLLAVGLVAGNLLAFTVIGWLGSTGIDLTAFADSTEWIGMSRVIYPQLQLRDFFIFNGLVFGLGVLVGLYPAWRAARFSPVEAMSQFN